jgi:hypothetical protein
MLTQIVAGCEHSNHSKGDRPHDHLRDNPATVPAPAGQYSHLARLDLGYKTMLQLSGQVAIDADGKAGCGRRAYLRNQPGEQF